VTIGQVMEFDGPDGMAPTIDVSNLSSTRREFNMGLPDEGQFTLECQYDMDDTGQSRCKTIRDARSSETFQVSLTDSPATTWTFTGYVLGFQIRGGIDDVYRLTITIKITAEITVA